MKKTLVLLVLVILTSCFGLAHYHKGTDFVSSSGPIKFKPGDVVYSIELETKNLHLLNNDGIIYKDSTGHEESYQKFIEFYDLEPGDDYGYSSPEEYFIGTYNKYFRKGLGKELLKNGNKYATIKWGDINYKNFVYSKEKTVVSHQDVIVPVPKDIVEFCDKFLKAFPDASYLILASDIFVSTSPLTYSVSYNMQNDKFGGAVLVPKTIIDLKNRNILGFDLNQTPMIYSVYRTLVGAYESAAQLDGSRILKLK